MMKLFQRFITSYKQQVKVCLMSCLVLLLLKSCNETKKEQKVVAAQEAMSHEKIIEKQDAPVVEIKQPSDFFSKKSYDPVMERLDSVFHQLIFLTVLDSTFGVVVANEKEKNNSEPLKYGLSDAAANLLLPIAYDKLYNPNATLFQCMEIRIKDKVGLFNFNTKQLLDPQFDFILPSGVDNQKAYGYADGVWYEIASGNINNYIEVDFDPFVELQQLRWAPSKISEQNRMLKIERTPEGEPSLNNWYIVSPSYIESFVSGSTLEEYSIFPVQPSTSAESKSLDVNSKTSNSIAATIQSFVLEIYNVGIDAREYSSNAAQILVYDAENNAFGAKEIGLLDLDLSCQDYSTKFINDSIVEIKAQRIGAMLHYSSHTTFEYYKISKDASIDQMVSNRLFDFTKFVKIDPTYFEGCYTIESEVDPNEYGSSTRVVKNHHLTVQDLDVMRNEIFAAYGLVFKSEQWKNYFNKKAWYKGSSEDVTDSLSEVDRHNIQVILDLKKEMLGKEADFLKTEQNDYLNGAG